MPKQSAIDLVEKVRVQAERSGAQEAETYLDSGTITEVRIRQGQVELVQQSSILGLGLRVFRDRRMGFLYTTDLRETVLSEIVNRTLALTNHATPRDENKIAELLLLPQTDLQIQDDAVAALRTEDLIRFARTAEDSAFAQDKRIETTKDVRCGTAVGDVYFSNTYIPRQTFRTTTIWLSATPVATQGSQHREGSFSDRRRFLSDLTRPEQVGQRAAERALAKLGAAAVPSAKVPVLFEAEAAGGFLQGLFAAFNAQNVLEQRSFLSGKLGQPVASRLLTVVDDGTLRRGLGSRYFDGEGVQTHRTTVVEGGVLRQYLHSAVTARRMGVPPTGNGVRSYDSLPTIGPTNFYIDYGNTAPDRLRRDIAQGLHVTGLAGFGMDTVSGEYSQQVEGHWIEKGEIVKPVEGVTTRPPVD